MIVNKSPARVCDVTGYQSSRIGRFRIIVLRGDHVDDLAFDRKGCDAIMDTCHDLGVEAYTRLLGAIVSRTSPRKRAREMLAAMNEVHADAEDAPTNW